MITATTSEAARSTVAEVRGTSNSTIPATPGRNVTIETSGMGIIG